MLATETDPDMKAYAEEELARLEERVAKVEEDLKVLLIPKDPNDEKNVILEIRAGTGVYAVCGIAAVEGGSAVDIGVWRGRTERSDRLGHRSWRLFTPEV